MVVVIMRVLMIFSCVMLMGMRMRVFRMRMFVFVNLPVMDMLVCMRLRGMNMVVLVLQSLIIHANTSLVYKEPLTNNITTKSLRLKAYDDFYIVMMYPINIDNRARKGVIS